MPSLSQLEAEVYWNREIVTPELRAFGDRICTGLVRPRAAFGTKGDQFHLRGAHRSQEWILKSRYCTSRTYTVESGLVGIENQWISGGDFNPASDKIMIEHTSRALNAMRQGLLPELHQFIGTLNGKTVIGYDNITKKYITSDDSHLWHWHAGWRRKYMRNAAMFARFYDIVVLGKKPQIVVTPPATGGTVSLTTAQNDALAETWTSTYAMRQGVAVPQGGKFAGGPHWVVTQLADMQLKLDALLNQIGSLTVAVANIENQLDAMSGDTGVRSSLQSEPS